MRQKIFAVIALLIFSITVYFVMTGQTVDPEIAEADERERQKEKEKEEKADETKGVEVDEEDAKKSGKKGMEDQYMIEPPFFRLPTIRVAILKDDGKIAGYLHLKLEMEAASLDDFNEAKILLSRLVDGIFADLYSALSNLWVNKEDPKIEVIKERVQRIADKILGKGKIKSVFVRQIFLDRQQL